MKVIFYSTNTLYFFYNITNETLICSITLRCITTVDGYEVIDHIFDIFKNFYFELKFFFFAVVIFYYSSNNCSLRVVVNKYLDSRNFVIL